MGQTLCCRPARSRRRHRRPGTSSFRKRRERPRSRSGSARSVRGGRCAAAPWPRADLVISAVTAAQIGEAAGSVAPHLKRQAYFFDLNSTSPAAKAGGCGDRSMRRVVGSSKPQSCRRSRRVAWPRPCCSAAHTRRGSCRWRRELGFTGAQLFPDKLGAASAAKMCRSVVVKGLEALMLESLLTARNIWRRAGGARLPAVAVLRADDWRGTAAT